MEEEEEDGTNPQPILHLVAYQHGSEREGEILQHLSSFQINKMLMSIILLLRALGMPEMRLTTKFFRVCMWLSLSSSVHWREVPHDLLHFCKRVLQPGEQKREETTTTRKL